MSVDQFERALARSASIPIGLEIAIYRPVETVLPHQRRRDAPGPPRGRR